MVKKGHHNNRYVYHYTKTYSLEDMKEFFGEGWHDLLDLAFEWVGHFPNAKICSAKRCMGMLHMFARAEPKSDLHAVEGMLWKIERMSSTVCEHCGNRGVRRKELKTIYCLCNGCYVTHLNNSDDPMSLFKPGQGGRF